jgi:hypothetical protein
MQDDYSRHEVSPDARTRADFAMTQGRMSHEIYSPRITEVATGRILLDLTADSEAWDGSVEWLPEGGFSMMIRHYYEGGRVMLSVHVSTAAGTFSIDGGPSQPIDTLQRTIHQAFYDKTMLINPPEPGSWEEEWLRDLVAKSGS